MKKIHWFFGVWVSVSVASCSLGFVPTNLQPVPSFSDSWAKPGMTEESWLRDWVACGGTKTGHVNEFPRLPGETDYDQHERTWTTLHRS